MARILITGITGQIAWYLAESLVAEGHEVIGLARREAKQLPNGVRLAVGALDRSAALLDEHAPLDAVVHLAAQSSVSLSWRDPMGTFEVNARLAACLAFAAAERKVRLVHASSAEIFGNATSPVQNEDTPIAPLSPYAVAKASAHLVVRLAREGLGAPASNLIFYLGESPRRAPQFVFRKITRTIAAIAAGDADELVLGNTSVIRDFCHARDLAKAARLLALGAQPGDYVCASGEGHTVLELAHTACRLAGVDPRVIRTDPSLFRPNEVISLIGDSTRLRALGWHPSVGFEALVREILEYDAAAHRSARRDGERG